MTTTPKRDSDKQQEDSLQNDSSASADPAAVDSSKRPRKEETKERWMTSRIRHPRVGGEFQVANLPTPGSTNADIKTAEEVAADQENRTVGDNTRDIKVGDSKTQTK
jgi:hypothetical protein